MYAYRPRRKNKTALLLTAAFTLVFLTGIFYMGLAEGYRYFVEFVSVSSVAIAILIAGRYLLKDYIYAIEEHGAEYDFVVTEVQGKRNKTVCRISVSEIAECVRETRETKKTLTERRKGMKRFDYCVDLGLYDAVCLFLTEDGRETAIRISPDARLESLLKMFSSGSNASNTEHNGI